MNDKKRSLCLMIKSIRHILYTKKLLTIKTRAKMFFFCMVYTSLIILYSIIKKVKKILF